METKTHHYSLLILLVGSYHVRANQTDEQALKEKSSGLLASISPTRFAPEVEQALKAGNGGAAHYVLPSCGTCWLVCSDDESSRKLADYVRKNCSVTCESLDCVFKNPYNLEDCRKTFTDILEEAQKTWGANDICVNVTFGTKEMSLGAQLAAVDARITHFYMTEGERNERTTVVISGTEWLEPFDPSQLMKEHDIRQAGRFFAHGDFYAAQQVLEPYKDETTDPAYDLVSICHFWQNLDYRSAAAIDTSNERLKDLKNHLIACKKATKKQRFSLAILRDILDWSEYAFERGIYERSVDLLHKGLEYAAKLVLCEVTEEFPDGNGHFPVTICDKLGLDAQLRAELNPDGKSTIALPMGNILFMFEHSTSDRAKTFHTEYGKHDLKRLTAARNGNIHNLKPYDQKGAQKFRKLLWDFLNKVLPALREQPSILQLQHLPKPNNNHH